MAHLSAAALGCVLRVIRGGERRTREVSSTRPTPTSRLARLAPAWGLHSCTLNVIQAMCVRATGERRPLTAKTVRLVPAWRCTAQRHLRSPCHTHIRCAARRARPVSQLAPVGAKGSHGIACKHRRPPPHTTSARRAAGVRVLQARQAGPRTRQPRPVPRRPGGGIQRQVCCSGLPGARTPRRAHPPPARQAPAPPPQAPPPGRQTRRPPHRRSPAARQHILVIPRDHIANVSTLRGADASLGAWATGGRRGAPWLQPLLTLTAAPAAWQGAPLRILPGGLAAVCMHPTCIAAAAGSGLRGGGGLHRTRRRACPHQPRNALFPAPGCAALRSPLQCSTCTTWGSACWRSSTQEGGGRRRARARAAAPRVHHPAPAAAPSSTASTSRHSGAWITCSEWRVAGRPGPAWHGTLHSERWRGRVRRSPRANPPAPHPACAPPCSLHCFELPHFWHRWFQYQLPLNWVTADELIDQLRRLPTAGPPAAGRAAASGRPPPPASS